jgi:hypothetical protein
MKEIQSELEIKSIPGDAERKALNEIHRLEGLLREREALAKQLDSQVHSLSSELKTIKKGLNLRIGGIQNNSPFLSLF